MPSKKLKIEEIVDNPDPRFERVTIFARDGKWYWTVKSVAFKTIAEALANAQEFCNVEEDQNA